MLNAVTHLLLIYHWAGVTFEDCVDQADAHCLFALLRKGKEKQYIQM